MSDDPEVPVVCPECNSETRVPLSTVADAVERHNQNIHDGEAIAHVDRAVAERLQEMVAEDLGLL